jgi:hypothetical protein
MIAAAVGIAGMGAIPVDVSEIVATPFGSTAAAPPAVAIADTGSWQVRIEDAIERRDADLEAIRLQMQTADRSEVIELERRLQLRKLDFEIEVLAMQVETFHDPVAMVDAAWASARAFRDRLIAVEPEGHLLSASSDSMDRSNRAEEVTR